MVHRSAIVAFFLLTFAPSAVSEVHIIPISAVAQGANNTLFRTDVRLFNPSAETTAQISAEFLPANRDNSASSTTSITIPPGEMIVLNNIVGEFFSGNGLGAIRFESEAELRATSRTFTDSPNAAAPGTFGQFIPAINEGQAMQSGVLLHLSNATDLSQGFRANVGFMNPGTQPVTVAVVLREANGTQLGTGNVGPIPPRSVSQVSVGNSIGNNVSFSNGYMTFSAATPVIGFASVVDNRSSDQIFVAAQSHGPEDEEDPPPAAKEVTVNVGPGLSFNPPGVTINRGDTVTWVFLAPLPHTSTSDRSTGPEVWSSGLKSSGTFSHTFQTEGSHPYFCQVHSFPGGNFMNGVVNVTNVVAAGTAKLSATGENASSAGPPPTGADRELHRAHTAAQKQRSGASSAKEGKAFRK